MEDQGLKLDRPTTEESLLIRPGYPRRATYPEAEPYGYGYGYEDQKGPINLKAIWRTIRKRKWLIAALVLMVTCVATVESYRNKLLYQASASIEVRSDNLTVVKTADVLVYSDDYQAMNTYLFMLKSRPLLKEVVARLELDSNPRFLDITERKTVWESIKTIGDKLRLGQREAASVEKMPQADSILELSAEESERLAPFADVIEGQLNVAQLPDARVLNVSFTHTDPVIAANVANAVSQGFIEHSFKSRTEKYNQASGWLDRTTRELKAKVEHAEQALADYSRDQNFSFSTENRGNLGTEKFMRLHDQVQRAETERVMKQSLYDEVKSGRIQRLPEAFADPLTLELQRKFRELSLTASQLDVRYGAKNPKVIEVREQIATLREQLDAMGGVAEDKLKADYERAIREEQTLKGILERSKGEAAAQNYAEIKYSLLKQDVETARGLYTEFLQKLNQAQIQLAEQNNNLALAEPAEIPMAPIGPNRIRSIGTALLLSLVAGIGLAFLIEYFDNTVKTVEDVNRYAQLPALGVIPMIGAGSAKRLSAGRGGHKALRGGPILMARDGGTRSGSPELVALENRSSAAEAYRVLRTSVLLSNAENPPKTILVTSGQPGEGKTTTVVNTAISLAQLGASVLIIDCDLRRPATHKVFGVEHHSGLSTYLSRNVEIDDLIQQLQIPNLSLLPCGPIPPNPAELISSAKMGAMLQSLSERYTHIIIDSPPVTNVTDPVILSTLVDGVILVVHGGKSTRELVRRTRQELTSIGAKIFGVVLNNVDFRNSGYDDYYNYYRGYYSNYGPEATTAQ